MARSNLFKTAIFGKDPNWGRVLSAVGTTDAVFEPDQLDVAMNGVQVCRNGGVRRATATWWTSSRREVAVVIDLQAGDAERHHLDQRPHPRLRPREQRLLELSEPAIPGDCSMNTQTRETTSTSRCRKTRPAR